MLTKLTKSRISAPSALEDGEHPRQSLRPAEAQSGGGCVNSTDRAAQTDGRPPPERPRWESNPRPPTCRPSALPTELVERVFSADHRDECTLDNPHTAAPVGGARLAIRRASFATSDCLQSPQLRGGLDHAPVSRRCSNISHNGPCTEHSRLS